MLHNCSWCVVLYTTLVHSSVICDQRKDRASHQTQAIYVVRVSWLTGHMHFSIILFYISLGWLDFPVWAGIPQFHPPPPLPLPTLRNWKSLWRAYITQEWRRHVGNIRGQCFGFCGRTLLFEAKSSIKFCLCHFWVMSHSTPPHSWKALPTPHQFVVGTWQLYISFIYIPLFPAMGPKVVYMSVLFHFISVK